MVDFSSDFDYFLSMKIERINENQIKCTLNRSDLASRQLKISELAYGSEKTQALFQDMMEQASNEVGFEASDNPLMIEAIPVSTDCIVLMITKVEDPEEIDTKFSQLTQLDDLFGGTAGITGTEAETFITALSEKIQSVPLSKLYSFDNLDTVISFARHANVESCESSRLYKSTENGRYYLLLDKGACDIKNFGMLCNTALEYGCRETMSFARGAFMDEHFDIILKEDALPNLANV